MISGVITEVPGGMKALGCSIQGRSELAQLFRKGLPADSLIALGRKLDLRNSALPRKLGIPQRTLTRRLAQPSRLTAAESDRAVRLGRVYRTAVEMIGDAEKAAQLNPVHAHFRQVKIQEPKPSGLDLRRFHST